MYYIYTFRLSGVHKGGFSKGGFSNDTIMITHKLLNPFTKPPFVNSRGWWLIWRPVAPLETLLYMFLLITFIIIIIIIIIIIMIIIIIRCIIIIIHHILLLILTILVGDWSDAPSRPLQCEETLRILALTLILLLIIVLTMKQTICMYFGWWLIWRPIAPSGLCSLIFLCLSFLVFVVLFVFIV